MKPHHFEPFDKGQSVGFFILATGPTFLFYGYRVNKIMLHVI
jgi:hypothetical protein